MFHPRDLTIDEVVRDSMIGMLLKADGVDPKAFETLLRCVARRSGARSRDQRPAGAGAGAPCMAL